MSGTIYKYYACRNPDRYFEGTGYDLYREARDAASVYDGCVVEVTYTYDDSEMVDDFRSDEGKDEQAAKLLDSEDEDSD